MIAGVKSVYLAMYIYGIVIENVLICLSGGCVVLKVGIVCIRISGNGIVIEKVLICLSGGPCG